MLFSLNYVHAILGKKGKSERTNTQTPAVTVVMMIMVMGIIIHERETRKGIDLQRTESKVRFVPVRPNA